MHIPVDTNAFTARNPWERDLILDAAYVRGYRGRCVDDLAAANPDLATQIYDDATLGRDDADHDGVTAL